MLVKIRKWWVSLYARYELQFFNQAYTAYEFGCQHLIDKMDDIAHASIRPKRSIRLMIIVLLH